MVKVNRHVDRVAGHLLTPGCQASPETEADPGRAFAFECSMMEFHYSTWGYRFEPTESGCRVTEWSDDLRPEAVLEFSRQTSGIEDRTERNRTTMSLTLERPASSLEADSLLGSAPRSLGSVPRASPCR